MNGKTEWKFFFLRERWGDKGRKKKNRKALL
jgi:hypothetical protein